MNTPVTKSITPLMACTIPSITVLMFSMIGTNIPVSPWNAARIAGITTLPMLSTVLMMLSMYGSAACTACPMYCAAVMTAVPMPDIMPEMAGAAAMKVCTITGSTVPVINEKIS